MERPTVRILVVVASIQMRTLKTEVEKGSVLTAIGHGLVSPKGSGNSIIKGGGVLRARISPPGSRKGSRSIFLHFISDLCVATQVYLQTPLLALGRVLFSF